VAFALVSYRVIVELISATTTKTGLTVRCELDTGLYPSGIVVSDAEIAALNIKRAQFHGASSGEMLWVGRGTSRHTPID
jgi:hypothetical protein